MQRVLIVVVCALAALLAASVIFTGKVSSAADILESAPYKTGMQNSCLGWDDEEGIFLAGTYNNVLMAFDEGGGPLWTFNAKGPFRQLLVRGGTVYAANEDNHVYILDSRTGSLVGDINVERRIYNIDVTGDGRELLISAGVSASKHNILLYRTDGEQIANMQFDIRIQGAAYAPDYRDIILVNNRGQVRRIDRTGGQKALYQLSYELVDLVRAGTDRYIVLSRSGSYHVFDGDLALLREGTPSVSFTVTGRAAGSDSSGDYVFSGTEEKFLYVFNKEDTQIYTVRLENSITNIMPLGDDIYVTGLGDFVYKLNAGKLAEAEKYASFALPLKIADILLALALAVCLFALTEKTRKLIVTIGGLIYRHRVAYLLLLPTFALLILFNYSSVFLAMTRAFTNWSKDNTTWATMRFVGLDNFRRMISEGYFLRGLFNLFLFFVTGLAKIMTVPLLVAYLVYSIKPNRQKMIFRFLFVLPMVVPGVVSALMWKQIYDPNIGLINQLLSAVGLDSWRRVWLGEGNWAIWAIIFMGFPFVNPLAFLVYYGGLMDIDPGILESARIDGANRWKIFFRIQFPILTSQIKILVILLFIGTVQDFGGVYLLTGGGPGTSTYVPGLELYFNTTQFGRFGYACALGFVLFLFTMAGTLINMRIKTHAED